MIPFFPKQIANRAIIVYLAAIFTVSIVYSSFAMSFGYIVMGLTFVLGFFLIVSNLPNNWLSLTEKRVVTIIFILAFSLRLIWVISSYFYYTKVNGLPFEFGAADSLGYHEEASWLSESSWNFIWSWYFGGKAHGISDLGYPLYLTLLYKLFGINVFLPRLIKVFISSFSCVLIYRLSSRCFGEGPGRIAGIMCALMPNLILYCGYHLKETEMLFLVIAFLERMDYLLRAKKWSFINILVPILLAGSLFFFRTVLGAAAIFAFSTAVLLSNTSSMKKGWKRAAIIGWSLMTLVFVGGGTVITEVEALWEEREEHQEVKRYEQTLRGNQWAKYATGTVMAPMAFVLPFSTMVDVDQQYGQQEKHSGNYIRNFMGFFAILAIYEAVRRKQWRDFALIGSFVIAYLGVISLSGFANSERFLLPGLPCLIMMWAYGISSLRTKTYRLLTPWCIIVLAMELGWAYFKLGSRGLFI